MTTTPFRDIKFLIRINIAFNDLFQFIKGCTRLARKMSLPVAKQADALHIAIAATAKMDYLPTWNCAHIANIDIIGKVEALCEQAGYRCPLICTTDELMTP